ncbi:MAG TPA: FtsX-like permease family protein [Thermoanaerobaculia bacterium]|nr:FtsX-like permease family protein [Thermoanaerobaculia bacterium]
MAAGGIGLGVAALVLALGALSGLQDALRAEVLARTPHLEVELSRRDDLAAARTAIGEIAGVLRVEEMVRGRGWVKHGVLVQPVEMVGFEGEVPRFFPGAAGSPAGLFLSESLAARWGLRPGDVVEVVSPRPTLSPLGPQPRVRSLAVSGTFASGRTEEIERIALPLAVARPLAGGPGALLEVTVTSLDRALAVVPLVRQAVPADAVVRTWEQLNRPLFFALRLEKTVMFVAVSLIVLVAAMALVADLALVIASKRRELGMLGAMGAAPQRLRAAFLTLGALLAGIGTLGGAVVGWAAAVLLDRYQVLRLPGQVYFLDYLPFRVEGADLVAVLLITFALALGSSWYVAQRVDRLQPVEALRR